MQERVEQFASGGQNAGRGLIGLLLFDQIGRLGIEIDTGIFGLSLKTGITQRHGRLGGDVAGLHDRAKLRYRGA